MARIETYNKDINLTGDEKVIGTDSDKSTANYSIEDIRKYVENKTNGIGQDNINVMINVSSNGTLQSVADAINSYSIEGEPLEIIDKQILKVKAFETVFSAEYATLSVSYYHILNKGKGLYGVGGSIEVQADDLVKFESTNIINIDTEEGQAPVVYRISNNNIDNAALTVNNTPEDFTIQNEQDAYFLIYKPVGFGTGESLQTDYKIYRFVGEEGVYGNINTISTDPNPTTNETAVTADFELVESFEAGNAITDRKYVVPTVVNGFATVVIPVPEIQNVSDAVRSAYANTSINISKKERVTFEIKRFVNGNLRLEKYFWRRGKRSNIQLSCTINDFELYYDRTLASLSESELVAYSIDSIYGSDILTPDISLNNSEQSFEIVDTVPQYFLSTSKGSRNVETVLYLFTGSAGTYGSGQANTAVIGDFQLIEYEQEEDFIKTKTSQLKNDGADGINPFITAQDIPVSVLPTGLEAIDEGNGLGYRLIGKDPLEHGNVGLGAIDFSTRVNSSLGIGALGQFSMALGEDSIARGFGDVVLGFNNQTGVNGTSTGFNNLIIGNNIRSYNYSANGAAFGQDHILSIDGADGNNGINYWGLTSGRKNTLRGKGSTALGLGLINTAAGCTVVGIGNADITNTIATQFTATTNTANNPAFVVGIGNVDTNYNTVLAKNGLEVIRTGMVKAPFLTNALIDSDEQSLITKKYYDDNGENPFTVVFKSPSGGDDSIAVNAAISNLPIINGDKSGHIKFGDGVWDFQSPLNLDGNNNITLSGNGGATVFTSSVGGIIIQSYKTDFSSRVNENIVIENILFKGDDTLDTTAISMRVRHNSIIRNCFFKGQTLTGFDGQDLNNVKIINNDFVNVNYGIILEAVTYDIEDFIIKGNDISYVLSNAIKIDGSNSLQSTGAQKIIITNNTIEECDLGGINLIEVFSSTILNNTISQCIDYLIRAQDGNNIQISNNILKEALNSGNGVTFINQNASNIVDNSITDVVNTISFDANSSANIAMNNGRLNIEDLSEQNFYTKQDGSGSLRPIEHTYGSQARFKSRASSTGGGFTDIHYLFESQLDNRSMAVALNAPIGQDARLYFNRDRTRGWVFHYQTSNDFDLFNGADVVFRWKQDNDFRAYYNGEIDGDLQVKGDYKTSDGSTGWTGNYNTGAGDTVTVKNGIITDVQTTV